MKCCLFSSSPSGFSDSFVSSVLFHPSHSPEDDAISVTISIFENRVNIKAKQPLFT